MVRAFAADGPVALLIDDVDLLDADSVDALGSFVRSLDVEAVAVISSSVTASPWSDAGGETVRVEPLTDDQIAELLVGAGLTETAALRCSEAAAGNPGLAMALADGLTAEQRRGRAPIASLPRPTGTLAEDLRNRLAEHGERIGRAIVVAASEPGGDVKAVRAALTQLGESAESLDDAEEAGLIEIIGARLIFPDPWTALVAPSLVAPSSRRAAHRALATAFARPDQAAARAWQLAAGASGPSDDVAGALRLIANDAAQRGAIRTAISNAERAAEFAEDEPARIGHLIGALAWAIDAADATAVRRIDDQLRASTVGAAADLDIALAETRAFLHGEPLADERPPTESSSESVWAERRDRRRRLARALDCGDHAAALGLLNQGRAPAPGTDARPDDDGVSSALAHRHRGDVRAARAALLATPAGAALIDPEHLIARDAPYAVWTTLLVAADLNILAGRGDDAAKSLALNAADVPSSIADWATVLTERAALQVDPSTNVEEHRDAFTPFGSGALLDVRVLVATGLAVGDLAALDEAIELAERERLPIEAAEARLWAIPLRDGASRQRERSAAGGALQRSGVRGWDRRIEHPGTATGGASSTSSGVSGRTQTSDPEVAALSAAERRVAEAVASGMTNRETAASLIVSVKTVDFHLQQIYRKLGIRSRTELAIRMMQGHGND